jgi:hypothetical protein
MVATQVTDGSGLFAFGRLDPGSYVVELLDGDQSALAASGVLNVNSGESMTTVVKLPFRMPPLGGLLGHTKSSALAIAASAAGTGVLAVSSTTDASPDATNVR